MRKFIVYQRGAAGEDEHVAAFLATYDAEPLLDIIEQADAPERPALRQALRDCRRYRVPLLVGKLGRLAHSPEFLDTLRDSRQPMRFADRPGLTHSDLADLAALAHTEARQRSQQTQAGISKRQAQGKPHGDNGTMTDEKRAKGRVTRETNTRARTEQYRELFAQLDAEGHTSYNAKAAVLRERQVPIPSGKGHQWSTMQVSRVAKRLERYAQELEHPLL